MIKIMKDMYPELTDYERGYFDRANIYNKKSKIYILIADVEDKIGHGVSPKNRFAFVRNQARNEVGAIYNGYIEYETKSDAPLIERKLLDYYKKYNVRKNEHFATFG